VVGDFGKYELIKAIPGVYKGRHVTNPKFTHIETTAVRISTATPAMVQLDGELIGKTPVTFSVLPGAISLIK
jgi:diacylglycerol kinase (ATP)